MKDGMGCLQSTNQSREVQMDEAAREIQDVALLYLYKKHDNTEKLKRKIHDVLFEEKQTIPEGVYIKLMNVIK